MDQRSVEALELAGHLWLGENRGMSTDPEYPGDPRHPDHDVWLLELGRATYAAASLSGIAFDVLRVHSGIASETLYKDPFGTLLGRLRDNPPALDGMQEFLDLGREALTARNDVMHALPVLHGLHRRRSDDLAYVRNYFDLEALREATAAMVTAHRKGNNVLYADGGTAVRRWVEGG